MNLSLTLALKGRQYDEQVELCKQAGLSESDIPDFLHNFNRPRDPLPERKESVPVMQTEFRERVESYIKAMVENPRVSEEQVKLNQFERDILHNQYLMGGSTLYDKASFHNPELKETEVFQWFKNEFALVYLRFALIFGGAGSGKTWGALAYANSVAEINHHCGVVQYSDAAYIHAYKLSSMLQNVKKNQEDIDRLTRKRILILDDLGTEPLGYRGSDFIAHLEFLIEERHKFRRITIMTSNMTPETFKEVYGDRVVSRFNETGLILETKQADLRTETHERL